MDNQTNEKNAEIFDAFQQLKTIANLNSDVNLKQAKWLAFMKYGENFKTVLGDPDATWRAFIAQPELQPLKVSKADRLAKIYKVYITDMELTEEDILGVDSNSLHRLTNVVNKENVKDWLNKAKTLSRADLFREIKFGAVEKSTCQHDWRTKQISICKLCGAKETKKI
jgi:hypothetical protein